jgi:hypothetical protein
MPNPKWRIMAARVGPDVLTLTNREFDARLQVSENLDAGIAPQLALYHLQGCLNASIDANARHLPSVAICLIRQCVEALAVIDAGFQGASVRDGLLGEWLSGKRSCGELRKALETTVWPRYELGLWNESWAEFFGNLAKAVQPYAHYTQSLLEWQKSVIYSDGVERNGSVRMTLATSPTSQDAVKLSRIALLQSLVIWTLARLLLANVTAPRPVSLHEDVEELGRAIGSSKLLFKSRQWADELMPHVIFKPGQHWCDA